MTDRAPRTRWDELVAGPGSRYAETFDRLIDDGEDVDGEARLADALAPRRARILDAGSGMGRVAAALAARGHDVTAVEKDPDLIDRSRRRYPDVAVVESDLVDLTPAVLEAAGRPAAYDVVVVVGNVMVYLADDTEVRALRALAGVLRPGGRMLLGFDSQAGPRNSRDYPVETFLDHVAEAGLVLDHLFGTFDLAPRSPDFVVAVLRRPS